MVGRGLKGLMGKGKSRVRESMAISFPGPATGYLKCCLVEGVCVLCKCGVLCGVMFLKDVQVMLHPIQCVVFYFVKGVWSGYSWSDEFCQSLYLSLHTCWESVCLYCCVNNLLMMCDLNELKVLFCLLFGE